MLEPFLPKQGQTANRTEVIDKSDKQNNILKIKIYIQKGGQTGE